MAEVTAKEKFPSKKALLEKSFLRLGKRVGGKGDFGGGVRGGWVDRSLQGGRATATNRGLKRLPGAFIRKKDENKRLHANQLQKLACSQSCVTPGCYGQSPLGR